MDILSKHEEERLSQARIDFDQTCGYALDALNSLGRAKQKLLQDHISCVRTAIDSFGSATFIVSCVGMLKSGKSTLVNLFSRNALASPTGYGFDTTLRPALITDCEDSEGHIEIWLPNNPAQPLSKAIFDKLFFHLRGVSSPDNVPEVTCHTYRLTEANLRNALCKEEREAENNMLPTEPALVVVKVPRRENSLLSSEILILDTPGLDSGRSEWTAENSERYSWIISNSDLLLFLQSSVSPLNLRAAVILHDIREHNPSTPVWLIQNEMILKPWLPEKRIKEATEEQRKIASEMFNRISRAFKQVNANLGKADSAIFDQTLSEEELDELWESSQFASMEQNIREDLRTNIGPIRRANCKTNALREIRQMEACIEQLDGEAKSYMDLCREEIREMEKFRSDLENILRDPQNTFPIIRDVEMKDDSIPINRDELMKICKETYRQKLLGKECYRRSDLENFIKETKGTLIDKMKEALAKTKLNHFSLKSGNDESINEIGKYMVAKFGDRVRFWLNSYRQTERFRRLVDECCDQVELPIFPDKVGVDVNNLPRIDSSVELRGFQIFAVVFRSMRKWDAEIVFEVKKKQFEDWIGACKKMMMENLRSWLNTVYKTMLESFITNIITRIEREKSKLNEELEKRRNETDALNNMRDGCADLKKDMEIFE